MKEKVLMLLACLWLTVGLAMAQNSKVIGIVTDAEGGEPVIGASVLVEGTTVGAITDLDGNFVIENVPANAKDKQTKSTQNSKQTKSKTPTTKFVSG